MTARALGEELETSLRTVYRDVADLIAQHVPVRGEAGVGYVLAREYDMPPLMLTPDEIEAFERAGEVLRATQGTASAEELTDALKRVRQNLDLIREALDGARGY